MSHIELIVGLGNPGSKHEATRHNVGFWFVDQLARSHGGSFKLDNKFHGEISRVQIQQQSVWLLKPNTYMNRSGTAVQALANFYKIPAENILVIYDELALPVGSVKLKQEGGHGGHNGMRDIISHIGSKNYGRIRIGIGHPGHASQVSSYVLGKPSAGDKQLMENIIDECLHYVPDLVKGDWNKAMNHLHSIKPAGTD